MKAIKEEYGRGYTMLRDAIEGLSEEEIRFKPALGKWSIHEIIIHVADSEILSTHRLRKVLAEHEPLLISFDQDAWVDELGYDRLDREQHLLLFQTLRASMQPILEHLTSEQAERVGVYADAGRFTFAQLLEYRVEHVRDHLAQIERVKEAYRQYMAR
ncbi:DinB family protein [Brevibacillus choshinensis]|uniref:DinB family protein n=1 Tax=Brevibacillus choshinensis TaxID=54911 RepID=A0ABX7FI99_BRECH|nr:DinB family protein [Brevibacillus choshinensis]QRG65867.1 DinB family protein [Brevibacillus choshinensis]